MLLLLASSVFSSWDSFRVCKSFHFILDVSLYFVLLCAGSSAISRTYFSIFPLELCPVFSFYPLTFCEILLDNIWFQCHVSFRGTAKWFSYLQTHIHSFLDSFLILVVLGWCVDSSRWYELCDMQNPWCYTVGLCWLSIIYIVVSVCVFIENSWFIPLHHISPLVDPKFVLNIYKSVPIL